MGLSDTKRKLHSSGSLEYGLDEEHRLQVDVSPWPPQLLAPLQRSSVYEGPGQEFPSHGGPRKSSLLAESGGGTRFRNTDLDNIDFKAVLSRGRGEMWGWEEKLEIALDITFFFFFFAKSNFYLV